jgi:hypothetical protein
MFLATVFQGQWGLELRVDSNREDVLWTGDLATIAHL